jgi:hypothetical protein
MTAARSLPQGKGGDATVKIPKFANFWNFSKDFLGKFRLPLQVAWQCWPVVPRLGPKGP